MTPKDNAVDDGRIVSIETNYERISEELHQVTTSMEKHAERTASSLETLNNKINAAKVPQWSALASWAAIILTIVALLLSGYSEDQTRLDTNQKGLIEKIESSGNMADELQIALAALRTEFEAYQRYELKDNKEKTLELERRVRELELKLK